MRYSTIALLIAFSASSAFAQVTTQVVTLQEATTITGATVTLTPIYTTIVSTIGAPAPAPAPAPASVSASAPGPAPAPGSASAPGPAPAPAPASASAPAPGVSSGGYFLFSPI